MNSPRYQQLADKLAQQIRAGVYKSDEKLESVRGFAKQQRVSVSTVLMSYGLLEDWGLVEVRPKSGYYVRALANVSVDLPKLRQATAAPKPVSSSQLVMDVMRDSSDPQFLSLGTAVPASDFPIVSELKKVFSRLVRTQPFLGIGYEMKGNAQLRRQLAKRAQDSGVTISPDEVVVTAGCQGAISLSLRVTCKPGDVVVVESPSYYGLLQLIESLGLKVIEIPSDPQTGMSIDALQLALEQWPIKAILTVSSFSNPLGALIPDENKKRLVDLVNQYQIPLIEDDIYGDLGYGIQRPRSIKSFDTEGRVLLCSSVSKVLDPQLGVGWVMPGRYLEAVEYERFLTSTSQFHLSQMALADILSRALYDRHLRLVRETYRQRRDRLIDMIGLYFPEGTRMSYPLGGFVAWIQLPQGTNATELYLKAKNAGVIISPGTVFSSNPKKYDNSIRLTYAEEWTKEREFAVQKVGSLAHALMS